MPSQPTPSDFIQMVRSLRLFVPQLSLSLAEQFIRDRYRRLLERRPWSALRGEGEFLFDAAKTDGRVTFVRGTPTITGVGTTFDADDVGRQFKAGSGSPVYTITAVDVGGQILTLDANIGVVTTANASYQIFDGYVTPPDDFMYFLVATDPIQGYNIRHWVTQDDLNAWDPMRTFFGQPYVLADRMMISNQPQYEAWPYATTERVIHFYYIKRGADLVDDTDIPIWPIRSDVIVTGALADVCRWPGTAQQPNPMFARLDIQRTYEAEYEDKLVDLERADESIFMTWLSSNSWLSQPFAPFSTNYLQTHVV